jgi:dTDP-4-dehydrorhamnose reductase
MANARGEAKLLIIGASGFIGSNIIRGWGARPALSTYLTRPFGEGVFFDVAHQSLRDRVLYPGHGFTHAVLAQGVTKLDHCATMRGAAAATNVTGTLRALDDLIAAGIHPIFLSSDAVFDGSPGLRTETEEPKPILSYGHDKREVEAYLSEQNAPWTILRLTKVVACFPDPRNMLSEWIRQINSGQPIRCAADQLLTPVDIDYVVQAVLFVIATSTLGLFHVSGSEALTRHTLLRRLLTHMPESVRRRAVVERCTIDDFAAVEKLPHNCALSNAKFVSLSGITPRPMNELCARLCATVFPDMDYSLEISA